MNVILSPTTEIAEILINKYGVVDNHFNPFPPNSKHLDKWVRYCMEELQDLLGKKWKNKIQNWGKMMLNQDLNADAREMLIKHYIGVFINVNKKKNVNYYQKLIDNDDTNSWNIVDFEPCDYKSYNTYTCY